MELSIKLTFWGQADGLLQNLNHPLKEHCSGLADPSDEVAFTDDGQDWCVNKLLKFQSLWL